MVRRSPGKEELANSAGILPLASFLIWNGKGGDKVLVSLGAERESQINIIYISDGM